MTLVKLMPPSEVPPQTKSVCPVTKPASSSRKNSTARLTSAGVPSRPTATRPATVRLISLSFGITSWNISVSSMGPGATMFTVMPSPASSRAQVRPMPMRPALVAE